MSKILLFRNVLIGLQFSFSVIVATTCVKSMPVNIEDNIMELLPQFLLIFIFTILILWRLSRKSSVDRFCNKFSGPLKFPLIGNLWFIANSKKRLLKFEALQRRFGSRVLLKGSSTKFLVLFHPDDVQKILSAKDMNKSTLVDLVFSDWIGSSMFISKGNEHHRKRKILLPAFDVRHVDSFEETLNENSKVLVNILKSREAEKRTVEISQLFSLCTLDMAGQYIGNLNLNGLVNLDGKFANALHNQLEYTIQRMMSPWLWPKLLWQISPTGRKERTNRKYLDDYIEKIVHDRQRKHLETENVGEENLNSEKQKLKLLDWLIRKNKEGFPGITKKYVVEEISASLVGAHDTVASSLTSTIYLLASHPEEQAKVHAELESIFGDDKERYVEKCDLPKLKYLECCMKETWRLYPPLPLFVRTIDNDFQLDKDLVIPKGVDVMLSPWVTQRLAEFFPEPEKFKPSRFFSENSSGRHPFCFFAFSAGQRSCMGQRIAMETEKTILAHIFRNFIVELEPGFGFYNHEGNAALYPENGLNIRLTLR